MSGAHRASRVRRRTGQLLITPFGLGVLGCLVLAGWALWSGGVLDGPVARKVRSASVYAAPGVGLDVPAAERVIGNRRLVVLLMRPGADLREACHDVQRAASGTLVLAMSRKDDSYDTYGCSLLSGASDKYFGKAFVAETTISYGIHPFADRPLEAIKVIAVNYDRLAKAGMVPTEARTISPSLPRYLVAAAAVGSVLVGSAVLYFAARRGGRLAAARRERRDRATDSRTVLSAATAAVAQQIIDLDARYAAAVRRAVAVRAAGNPRRGGGRTRNAPKDTSGFAVRYRELAAEYSGLLDDIAAADRRGEKDFTRFTDRAEALSKRLHSLAS
ncbi:hypothetical protein ABT297_12390 [Dactylosporangium sp. NPDC000555]|uniref:hypothetical protein n=1 Tax=Dactylosporangium sp. NPDC000555 TaxID=3154260 RepID=UPI003316FD5E